MVQNSLQISVSEPTSADPSIFSRPPSDFFFFLFNRDFSFEKAQNCRESNLNCRDVQTDLGDAKGSKITYLRFEESNHLVIANLYTNIHDEISLF